MIYSLATVCIYIYRHTHIATIYVCTCTCAIIYVEHVWTNHISWPWQSSQVLSQKSSPRCHRNRTLQHLQNQLFCLAGGKSDFPTNNTWRAFFLMASLLSKLQLFDLSILAKHFLLNLPWGCHTVYIYIHTYIYMYIICISLWDCRTSHRRWPF